MKQIVWIINCYLYGATLILLVVLALLVYLRGQANHLPNPFARRNIVYRPKEKAQRSYYCKALQKFFAYAEPRLYEMVRAVQMYR